MSSRSRSRSRDRAPEGKKIYVSNIDPDVTEPEIRELCDKHGTVENISVKKKGDDVTFAFIEYATVREAEKAIQQLNRFEFHGRSLKVEFAKGGNRREGGFRGRGDRGGFRPRGGDRQYGGSYGNRDNNRGGSQNECFNCHETGHFARECPKPREGFRGGRGRGGYEKRGYGDRDNRGDRDTRRRRSSSSRSNDRRRRDRSNQ